MLDSSSDQMFQMILAIIIGALVITMASLVFGSSFGKEVGTIEPKENIVSSEILYEIFPDENITSEEQITVHNIHEIDKEMLHEFDDYIFLTYIENDEVFEHPHIKDSLNDYNYDPDEQLEYVIAYMQQ